MTFDPFSHDTVLDVAEGDAVRFVVGKNSASAGGRTTWDPVITYVRR